MEARVLLRGAIAVIPLMPHNAGRHPGLFLIEKTHLLTVSSMTLSSRP